jgi:GR25 family glycosyltransferase involved in LPS biosynthesis
VISWAVVGHEARTIQATDLAHQLGAVITIDDGTAGADANHLKAWDMVNALGSRWSAVMEDDAVPVRGFLEQAEAALAAAPAPVVSFYVGTGRPVRWQDSITRAIATADRVGAHWITCNHLLHAVAVAIRTDLVEDWLSWSPTSNRPIDERLTAWCLTRKHQVAYTWPCLVDHADGPTLVKHRDGRPRDLPRKARRTGTREAWTSAATPM